MTGSQAEGTANITLRDSETGVLPTSCFQTGGSGSRLRKGYRTQG